MKTPAVAGAGADALRARRRYAPVLEAAVESNLATPTALGAPVAIAFVLPFAPANSVVITAVATHAGIVARERTAITVSVKMRLA